MIEFADIASYQHGADLAAYARAGHDRIAIKATEGGGGPEPYINPDFPGWWRDAGNFGLARIVYHYATPDDPIDDQAVHFLRTVNARDPRDVLAVDAEDPERPQSVDGRRIAALVTSLAARGAPTGMIYGPPSWINDAGLLPTMLPRGWRWLWLAAYTSRPFEQVPIPAGWLRSQVLAWQYTRTATTAGIPGRCDRSRVTADWLSSPGEDDMPLTIDDINRIAAAVWAIRPPEPQTAEEKPIAQPDMLRVVGATYRKAGAIQAPGLTGLTTAVGALDGRITALQAGLALLAGDHPAAEPLAGDVRAAIRQLLAQLDAGALLGVAQDALARLQPPAVPAPSGGS